MILPAKHLKPERSLLVVGAVILQHLSDPIGPSELWERVRNDGSNDDQRLSFEWFCMALTFLYSIRAVGQQRGLIVREVA